VPEVKVVRHPRARRYVLRLAQDGSLRLTVPRRGSIEGGLKFVEKQHEWIARERARIAERAHTWTEGTEIWWRGERVTLRLTPDGGQILCGDQQIPFTHSPSHPVTQSPTHAVTHSQLSLFAVPDLRASVEAHLRAVATRELPPRLWDLAREHRVQVARVSVRNQRARWGACSSTGTITLNWRLLQLPPWVSDYVLCHELMHRRQPNHSRAFWREVATVCPAWREAERWIRKNGRTIL
jgi:predicted metal-dependent hydrolase